MADKHPGDGNKGNDTALQRYWHTGKGATEVARWGTPGDWERCVKALEKHGLSDPKGYCAKVHHEVTGEWPGPNAHGGKDHGKH